MKSLMILALAFGGLAAATPAAADRTVVRHTTVVQHHDSGWHRKHRVCAVRWRHHHRVRTCHWR